MLVIKKIFVFIGLAFPLTLFTQNIDSLKSIVSSLNDTSKINTLNILADKLKKSDPLASMKFAYNALELAEEASFKKGMGDAYICIGDHYTRQGNYQKAFEYLSSSLKIREQLNDKKGLASAYNSLGNVYGDQRDFKNGYKYFEKAYLLRKEINDLSGVAASLNNMGTIYYYQQEYRKALDCFFESLKIKTNINDKSLGYNFNNIALVYSDMSDADQALAYFMKALRAFEVEKDKAGITVTRISIGDIYYYKEMYDSTIKYAGEALKSAGETGATEQLANAYGLLSQTYARMGNYRKAYEFSERENALNDSLFSQSSLKEMRESEFRNDMEKRESMISMLKKDKQIQSLLIEKNRIWIIGLVGGCLMIALVTLVIFSRYRVKKTANALLTKQNLEIQAQKKDITDSINYAKRIQEAILPAKEIKYRIFPNAFVLFQPRDIVSGDFYWFAEKNDNRLIAAVDCTGHGVPGAFMSMIGNAFLNEIVNEKGITTPSEILNLLRANIVKSLKQTGAAGENKDGMDIALLSFSTDEKNPSVEFSGANNSLWLVREGKLQEYAANKEPVGFQKSEEGSFTNHKIALCKGDTLYIFTDGYADQFGGPKGKKFKYRQLQEILMAIQDKPMPLQEEILLQKFSDWKGEQEQVDDVCVIGVRI